MSIENPVTRSSPRSGASHSVPLVGGGRDGIRGVGESVAIGVCVQVGVGVAVGSSVKVGVGAIVEVRADVGGGVAGVQHAASRTAATRRDGNVFLVGICPPF